MDAVTLYSTWPSRESAEAAARALLEQRLIACANILPGAVSLFRWEGEIQVESEAVMFAKTSAERAPAARDAMLQLHPYSLPSIAALRINSAESSASFLEWIGKEVISVA